MANHYTLACFAIPLPAKKIPVTEKRVAAIREYVLGETAFLPRKLFHGYAATMAASKEMQQLREAQSWCLSTSYSDGLMYLFHDESIDMDLAVVVAQMVLTFEADENVYCAEWACICDKARKDAFGGGTVAFNYRNASWMSTHEMRGKLAKELG